MNEKVRVLVVDDSAVIRCLVTDLLSADPDLEVVGSASNGKIALAKIEQCFPDVVTLDLDMPVLDGLETLRQIRRDRPKLPVVILSSLTRQGASQTLDCLYHGASDYVTKPSATDVDAMERLRVDLVSKVRHFGRYGRQISSSVLRAVQQPPAVSVSRAPVRAVVIAASTGGPNALAELLGAFLRPLPVPLFVVQHMPPIFTRALAERLDGKGGLSVQEAVDGRPARAGEVWIAPGDLHMESLKDGAGARVRVFSGPPENSCRPSADVLFRSAASSWGAGVLAVVMTGMGQDGLRGARALREAGSRIIVQDPKSSIVWGMPGAIVEAGIADTMLPPEELAREIDRRCGGRNGP